MSNQAQASGQGRLADFAQDGAALLGAGMITYGVDLIYTPAGYIIAGLFLLSGAWIAARKGA